jgi:hypothetical protein
VGPWFLSYQPAVPLVLMIIGLLVMPLGIVSVDWRGLYKMVLRK